MLSIKTKGLLLNIIKHCKRIEEKIDNIVFNFLFNVSLVWCHQAELFIYDNKIKTYLGG